MGDIMFTIIPIMVFVVFAIVIGTIIVRATQGAQEWKTNNNSPVLTVDGEVITKRADVRSHNHMAGEGHQHAGSSTTYYATFQFSSGDRLELKIPSKEYGMIVEKDFGSLTFQGTRYLEFKRKNLI